MIGWLLCRLVGHREPSIPAPLRAGWPVVCDQFDGWRVPYRCRRCGALRRGVLR